jgi:hyperosmotically inducible protein
MKILPFGLAVATAAWCWTVPISVLADPAPDNTKINVRDRDGVEPTAQNASNRKSDVKRSAKLRREILRQKGLSVNAQNVKLIDEGGCVVLRGPVDNLREREVITNLAKQCYGTNFRDELDIKNAK